MPPARPQLSVSLTEPLAAPAVPTAPAAVTEEGSDSDARVIRQEARARLKAGKGVKVFSRPGHLHVDQLPGRPLRRRRHLGDRAQLGPRARRHAHDVEPLPVARRRLRHHARAELHPPAELARHVLLSHRREQESDRELGRPLRRSVRREPAADRGRRPAAARLRPRRRHLRRRLPPRAVDHRHQRIRAALQDPQHERDQQ